MWGIALDILQWLCIIALFASRSRLKLELEALQMKEDPICFYCDNPKWLGREQRKGAWIHRSCDGEVVFCERQG